MTRTPNLTDMIHEAPSAPTLPRWLLKQMRQQLFRRLDQLPGVQLVVEDADGTHQLGDQNSSQVLTVQIQHMSFYAYATLGGSTGIGQAWILGLWTTKDLVELTRRFIRARDLLLGMDSGLARLGGSLYKVLEWQRRNTETGSRKNIKAHYDLGNEFFKLFLDDSLTYSAAVFADEATTLAQAQTDKYELICQKLNLQAGEKVLEIGTGWGGFAMHAAKNFGVQVTTTTLSDEQYTLACERVAQAGLNEQITLLKKDYRQLEGQYDKIVSIEMIEAVGHEFLPDYFKTLQNCLKADGELLIQAITIQDQYYEQMRKGTDFIREFVFPGGHLPSTAEMLRVSSQHSDLRLFDLEDFGQDYARTLHHWRHAFIKRREQVRLLGYPEDFCRLWDFYLASCEAGFLETSTSVVHAHYTRPSCHRERYGFQAKGEQA